MVESKMESRLLRVSEIDLIYPLVRVACPKLGLGTCRDVASAFLRPVKTPKIFSGVVVTEVQNVFRGLCTYAYNKDATIPNTFFVTNIVVPGPFASSNVVASLNGAVQQIARSYGASDICIELSESMVHLELDWHRHARANDFIPTSISIVDGDFRLSYPNIGEPNPTTK